MREAPLVFILIMRSAGVGGGHSSPDTYFHDFWVTKVEGVTSGSAGPGLKRQSSHVPGSAQLLEMQVGESLSLLSKGLLRDGANHIFGALTHTIGTYSIDPQTKWSSLHEGEEGLVGSSEFAEAGRN